MKIYYETERLILRNLCVKDTDEVFKWTGDPDVNTYMIYPLYTNAEDLKEWLKHREDAVDDPDDYDCGIALKETGELIGGGGLTYHKETDTWGIGYNLRKEFWGKGYAVEAMQGLMDLIRQTREIHAIEGEFCVENQKSQRVMEKLGMSFYKDSSYTKMDGSRTFISKVFRREFQV